MKVPNIPFNQYASIPNRSEYDYYLRYNKFEPVDVFELGPLMDLNFGFVKDMQSLLNYSGLTWESYFQMMSSRTGKDQKEIASIGLFTLQQGRVYLKEQIEQINALESDQLSSGTTQEEEQAGIEEFRIFRSFPQYDKIIKDWGMSWEEVDAMPYDRAFVKLKYDRVYSEFTERLQRIRTK
jgi:hypothetical protein